MFDITVLTVGTHCDLGSFWCETPDFCCHVLVCQSASGYLSFQLQFDLQSQGISAMIINNFYHMINLLLEAEFSLQVSKLYAKRDINFLTQSSAHSSLTSFSSFFNNWEREKRI